MPHLERFSAEDILVQGRDQDLRQMLDVLFCFLAALHHTAGHALQRLRQLLLQLPPPGVGGAVLLQVVHILWKHRGKHKDWFSDQEVLLATQKKVTGSVAKKKRVRHSEHIT